MSVNITALPSAAAPLAALHRACFPEDPWDADAIGRILALPGTSGFTAWFDDQPVGFALLRNLGDEAEILSIGVLPKWRRQGIGRALLNAVVAAASGQSLGSIVLEVAIDNDAAHRLYRRSGFLGVGRRPGYYRRPGARADALIMRRAVPLPTAE